MKNPNLGNRDLLLNRFATYTNCPASLEEKAVMEVFSQTGPVLGVCMVYGVYGAPVYWVFTGASRHQ